MDADERHEDFALPGEEHRVGTITVTEPEAELTTAELLAYYGKSCSACNDGAEACACGLVA